MTWASTWNNKVLEARDKIQETRGISQIGLKGSPAPKSDGLGYIWCLGSTEHGATHKICDLPLLAGAREDPGFC